MARQIMVDFEQTLLQEIAALPQNRRVDVLAFVRYLKLSISKEELQLEQRLDNVLQAIHARTENSNISSEDIDAEIRAVRDDYARRA